MLVNNQVLPATKLYDHSLYVIDFQASTQVLNFRWYDDHAHMTYEDFLEACSNYAGFVAETGAPTLLIDIRNFAYTLPEAFPAWQRDEHDPRLFRLGARKKAYLMQPAHLQYAQDTPETEANPAVRNFATEAEALAWLTE